MVKYEIPCNGDGRKTKVLDLGSVGRIFVTTDCGCPFCEKGVQFMDEEYGDCEGQVDEYFEERLSDCVE
ncbi:MULTISPECIES: hypothetical protein [unclassified Paenibacillus]|uniref:hypothetical protein n=1 Tax=unclassified Paenibacillus TaxID=185978 RepID=UPI001AE3470D|nr:MULTISPECIES: hypothetical protein [unclassified Paenibacillus]MBP1153955.1 hypothetical protein [Paenibacillus sp. PvP091]MBP1170660.1 hypothetical protein [Paenibacillus sp. PvR098]MBP2441688.1 hypothetical protein [Paenibacillus sp. PvP052]